MRKVWRDNGLHEDHKAEDRVPHSGGLVLHRGSTSVLSKGAMAWVWNHDYRRELLPLVGVVSTELRAVLHGPPCRRGACAKTSKGSVRVPKGLKPLKRWIKVTGHMEWRYGFS